MGGKQIAQILFGEPQQQGFVRGEHGHRKRLGPFQPTVTIGFGAVVTFDLEMFAEEFQQALDGAQVAFEADL